MNLTERIGAIVPGHGTFASRRAFLAMRAELADDIEALLGGTIGRLGGPSCDAEPVREVVRQLSFTASGYERMATVTPDRDMKTAAVGRAGAMRAVVAVLDDILRTAGGNEMVVGTPA